ncbi:MAG: sigma-70 family RNA polymerase sigma factor [Psychroflexus sp.]|jgi:RNA polymerase sigma-70 factor (ECF subfamily)|nr:sigma-70 family RNA polymerase sigma factor [Psychroflexus sp.]MDR9448469.1 sigma-70 family RNA polymerase sigma factor [Psychroflexus sp.]
MQQQEFNKIAYSCEGKMFRLAQRILISEDAAKDAVQEVFLKLWNIREKLGRVNNISAYAMRMTKNYCFDKLKAKDSQNLSLVHSNIDREEKSIQEVMEVKDEVDFLKRVINQLPERERTVIHLREIEEMELPAIAEITETKEGSVRVALTRARKKIKDEMIKYRKSYRYEA